MNTNERRTPPILALRPALYALACVFAAWMLSHVIIGALLVMALNRIAPPPRPVTPHPARHDHAPPYDYPF